MIPKSVLNDLRRQVVADLVVQREAGHRRSFNGAALADLRREAGQSASSTAPSASSLYVLVRTLEQLRSVLAWQPADDLPRPSLVYCDFEDVRRYGDAVAEARAAGMKVGVATLRVLKPHEDGLLAIIAKAEPDVVLARNLASVVYFRERLPGTPLVGDFSLNIANELTANLFAQSGLARLVPSYDLNFEQLADLLTRFTPQLFEIVVHQHMPMFHMEHCVFAHMLSDGKDYRDCGRPCDHHRVELRDRAGAEFPLLADTGCRNTVFNSVAQSAAEFVPRMQVLGARHFRVELLREKAADVAPLLDAYARVIAGHDNGHRIWRQLKALNQLGVTRGTLQVT